MSASFASPPYGEGKCLLRHRSNRPKLRNCPWTDTIPGHRSRQLGITQRSVGHLWKCEVCGYAFETTVSYATVTPLLCLDDFNSPVVGIYNRDHHHGISLLYLRASGPLAFSSYASEGLPQGSAALKGITQSYCSRRKAGERTSVLA